MEIVPATSITVPLMGKYIIFTMVMVTLSVFISVVTLNVRFRSSATHTMSKYTKFVFFQILPKFLFMDFPGSDVNVPKVDDIDFEFEDEYLNDLGRLDLYKSSSNQLNSEDSNIDDVFGSSSITSSFIGARPEHLRNVDLSGFCRACAMRNSDRSRTYPMNILKAIDGSSFVARHLQDDDQSTKVSSLKTSLI